MDAIGGTLRAIELNYFQCEIADFAYKFAQRKGSGDRVVLGVNKYIDEGPDQEVQIHTVDSESERRHITRLKEVKRTRDGQVVSQALGDLLAAARGPQFNIMPATIRAVKARASMGEIVETLVGEFGRYS